MICPECGVVFKGSQFFNNGERRPLRKCPNGHRFKEPPKPKRKNKDASELKELLERAIRDERESCAKTVEAETVNAKATGSPSENWDNLVKEYDHLIGNTYLDDDGTEWIFIGLLHGQDDFYFVMWRDKCQVRLLTCVGIPEQMGFKPSNAPLEPPL